MGDDVRGESRSGSAGMLYGIGAYGLWGIFPLYWKRLSWLLSPPENGLRWKPAHRPAGLL